MGWPHVIALLLVLGLISILCTECAENTALGRPAYQSSTGWKGEAGRAVDGNLNTEYYEHSCTHTALDGSWWPWWSVDLQWRRIVSNITLTNRNDSDLSLSRRLRKVHIGLTDVSPLTVTPALTNFAECAYVEGPVDNGATESFSCHNGGVMGRFLIVQLDFNGPLTLCEVQVYESRDRMWFTAQRDHVLSGHVAKKVNVESCLQCSRWCQHDQTCTSLNYHPESGSCELNDATYDEETSDVIASAGWAWYNRRV